MAKNLSLLDRRLLDAAANGDTPDELEDKFGIPAAQALARIKELLAGQNVWDDVEARRLRVRNLENMLRDVKAFGVDVGNPKHIEAVTKLVAMIDRISSNETKISEAELRIITEEHARAMLQIITLAYNRARDLLAREYPEVDMLLIDEEFHAGLREASKEIEA